MKTEKPYYLWLDDVRNPKEWFSEGAYMAINEEYRLAWVNNYNDAVMFVEIYGVPGFVDLDHDLGEENTGYDFAKWLVGHCMAGGDDVPEYSVHSANPVGRENIISVFKSYKKVKKMKMDDLPDLKSVENSGTYQDELEDKINELCNHQVWRENDSMRARRLVLHELAQWINDYKN